jgi:hypothetical protein
MNQSFKSRLGFKLDNHHRSSRVKDDGHRDNATHKKKKQEKNASEVPTVVCRFADDKASPQQKKRGDP